MQRVLLPALLLLGLQVPALAQTRPATDPWAGIVVVVTPEHEDEAGAGTTAEAAGQPADEQAVEAAQASGDEASEDLAPSLFTTLDLGLGDLDAVPAPEPTPAETIARQSGKAKTPGTPASMPTSVDLNQGPASLSLSSKVSTSAPVSSALATKPGGANGELKGRVDYSLDNFVVYGTGNAGAASSLGNVSLYKGVALGSSYKVPLDTLGVGTPGESLGTSVEVANTTEVKTSVELRSPLGHYERFISVERSATSDSAASGALRAGVLGKF